jgi:glutathione S-transferase
LETADGHIIFESISIAKYLARQVKGFYGRNDYETSLIDSWIDYINSTINPQALDLAKQVCGRKESDPKTFNLQLL